MRSGFLILLLVLTVVKLRAADPGLPPRDSLDLDRLVVVSGLQASQDTLSEKEPERWVAAGLALLVGPFGAHRLYFGTTAKVPIIYGVTFGGFGILVLIDIGHILATKDLSPYRHNDKVFMWAKPRASATPP
jgi:TM2 domain-containing membrane protein YozV